MEPRPFPLGTIYPASKFAAPRAPSTSTHRRDLLALLDSRSAPRLVCLTAPAGYGKTSLMAAWASSRAGRVAWLRLEAQDDSPETLRAAISSASGAALRATVGARPRATSANAPCTEPRAEPPELPVPPELSEIASAFGGEGGKLFLVLDDFQAIKSAEAREMCTRLIDMLPGDATALVASRERLPLALGRLRARGELLELGPEELRLDEGETLALLAKAMTEALSQAPERGDPAARDAVLSALESKILGWPAALALALGFLRASSDPFRAGAAFGGELREIYDFIMEEVLLPLSGIEREFLTAASILDEISAPIMDALLGSVDSVAILASLDRSCLLMLPLDGERRRYRLHPLLREALLRRLRDQTPAREAALRRAASDWLESADDPVRAMRQAALAGDSARAAVLAENFAIKALGENRMAEALRGLSGFSERDAAALPWLSAAAAWAALYAGDHDLAERRARAAERAATGSAGGRLSGHLAAIRAFAAYLDADEEKAASLSRRALELLPEADAAARCHALMSLGAALRLGKAFAESDAVLAAAVEESAKAGLPHVACLATDHRAEDAIALGRLQEAKTLIGKTLADFDPPSPRPPASGILWIGLARIAWEENELARAADCAREGLALCEEWGHADALFEAFVALALMLRSVGDFAGAERALARAGPLATTPILRDTLAYERLRVDLARGRRESLEEFFRSALSRQYIDVEILRVEYALRRKRWAEAVAIARDARARSRDVGYILGEEECLVEEALALRRSGAKEEARMAFGEALAIGGRTGGLRRFLEHGEGALSLAAEDYERARNPFALRVIEALEAAPRHRGKGRGETGAPTRRELEILGILARGKTAEAAASRLCLSPATVRAHVRNLYRKLGARKLVDALRRAEELGINLDP